MSGPIQGPLLSYETFTAFMLEASFFGVLVFGRKRVPPWFYLFATAMVSLGTTLSTLGLQMSWGELPVAEKAIDQDMLIDGFQHVQPNDVRFIASA